MSHLKALVAAAALAFTFAIPAAHAQPAQDRGTADCALKFVTCMASGGSVLTCGIEFAQCMAAGGASTAIADRREH